MYVNKYIEESNVIFRSNEDCKHVESNTSSR